MTLCRLITIDDVITLISLFTHKMTLIKAHMHTKFGEHMSMGSGAMACLEGKNAFTRWLPEGGHLEFSNFEIVIAHLEG